MKKLFCNVAIAAILFIVSCTFIAWDKETIKACITGGVFGAWLLQIVKTHWMK